MFSCYFARHQHSSVKLLRLVSDVAVWFACEAFKKEGDYRSCRAAVQGFA